MPGTATATSWTKPPLATWWLLLLSLIMPALGGSAYGTPSRTAATHPGFTQHSPLSLHYHTGYTSSLRDAALSHHDSEPPGAMSINLCTSLPSRSIPRAAETHFFSHGLSAQAGQRVDQRTAPTAITATGQSDLEPAFCHLTYYPILHGKERHPAMPCLTRTFMHSAAHRDNGSGETSLDTRIPHGEPPHLVLRFGEALHPGPTLRIGTTNPSGANGKAQYIADLPPGIWNLSETHLTTDTTKSFDKQLKFHTRAAHRRIRTSYGAPAPLRTGSQSAGTWTGVLQFADLPTQAIHVPNLANFHHQGRLHISRFWADYSQITGVALYGWPTSPTWPGARALTEDMLQAITQEVILGTAGLRFVAGDFNRSESLPSIQSWLQAGWIETQTLHHMISGFAPQNTYRGISRPDRIYLSPELAAYFKEAHYDTWFADHGALSCVLHLPDHNPSYWAWPLPGQIPWSDIDVPAWHATFDASTPDILQTSDPTQHYKHLGHIYERSLDNHLYHQSRAKLPPACLGRGQRLKPTRRQPQAPLLRPSRPGEEHLNSDLVSRSVLRWFRQLRRLQSMMHSLQAGGQGPTHQLYRAELWHAIVHATGLQHGFLHWWPTRKHRFQGSPPLLTHCIPSPDHMALIYHDYRYNFRSLESWNLQQKSNCSQLRLQHHHHRIFKAIKPASREPIDRLVEKQSATIIAVSSDGTQIHVDQPLKTTSPLATWRVDGTPATVHQLTPDTFEVDTDLLLVTGQTLHQHNHITTESQIHTTLELFWQQRWSKHAHLPPEAWRRITSFTKAYVPKGIIDLPSSSSLNGTKHLPNSKSTQPVDLTGMAVWTSSTCQHHSSKHTSICSSASSVVNNGHNKC